LERSQSIRNKAAQYPSYVQLGKQKYETLERPMHLSRRNVTVLTLFKQARGLCTSLHLTLMFKNITKCNHSPSSSIYYTELYSLKVNHLYWNTQAMSQQQRSRPKQKQNKLRTVSNWLEQSKLKPMQPQLKLPC